MIYLDYASTTPCLNEVVDEIVKYLNIEYGNPHSRSHAFGWEAEKAVENARKIIAKAIKAKSSSEIIFTSGATESNNLAIKGYVYGSDYKGGKLLTLETEHKCVIEALRSLKMEKFPVEFLKVEQSGLIDLDYLKEKLKNAEFLSISHVNNETGVIQNIEKISQLCKEFNVILHVDAAQSFGKIPINVENIHLLSISAHKIYGPKGIGALFVSKNPKVRIKCLINGGGQERNLRSGTLSPSLCAGFGKATEIIIQNMQKNYNHAKELEQLLLNSLNKDDLIFINGDLNSKIPYIVNLNIPYIEGESILMKLNENYALSSGSACTSKSLEPSHVIRAMNPNNIEAAHSSIRVCFGINTKKEEIQNFIKDLKQSVITLREMSPLWHFRSL